jgi:hypothetical protein
MTRAIYTAGVCLAGFVTAAGPAAAVERALASASATIVDSGGIQVISPLILPTVIATPSQGATFAGDPTYVGAGGTVYAGNARLTVRGQIGEALSMTVPASFTVVRTGGSEALTVRTSTSGEYGVFGDGILLSGAIMNGVATSVDIGGQLSLASSDPLVPGPYEGLFAVIVEYN